MEKKKWRKMGFSSGTWTSTTESSSCKQASWASDHHCSTSHSSLSFFLVSGFFSAPNGNQDHLHTLTKTPISVVFLLLSHKTKAKSNSNKQMALKNQSHNRSPNAHPQNPNPQWQFEASLGVVGLVISLSLDLSGCIPKWFASNFHSH
jgi:hypothetical protein